MQESVRKILLLTKSAKRELIGQQLTWQKPARASTQSFQTVYRVLKRLARDNLNFRRKPHGSSRPATLRKKKGSHLHGEPRVPCTPQSLQRVRKDAGDVPGG